ncbi:Hypothetical protein, putative [Bodo saltans]|uniref:Uncharacterized protein n=1 Tax=Bodo saltans TaxID=75058 RepID=A0A0S4J7L1_BODSA|nr:Hypothetical protein, putative [Bodo saltans]|eukprot:CUG86179.1 Hypothetical protein, putative [Bodo saltans]
MTFRGIWIIDVEHHVVLFSRRFPNVERSYLSYMSPPTKSTTTTSGASTAATTIEQQSSNNNKAFESTPKDTKQRRAVGDEDSNLRNDATTSSKAPQQNISSNHHDQLTSILGVSDTMLMDSLLSYISGSNLVGAAGGADGHGGGAGTDGSRSTLLSGVASSSHSSPGLARMKHGPFIPPLPIAAEACGEEGGEGTTRRSVVGPWVVCQSERGAVTIVTPPNMQADSNASKSKKSTMSKASPTLSTSSLPSLNLQQPQLVVLEHPDDVVLVEAHPRYAPKQNILIVALPLCRTTQALSSTAVDDTAYLSDPTILTAWEVIQTSIRPFVDHCLLVAPQLPPKSASSLTSGPPLILQPHGMIVAPGSTGGGSKDDTLKPIQEAPATWLDPKHGARQLHVVGGWSTRSTQRRVIAVYHWVQALHTLVATALPFGSPTLWLPQHSVTALGVGTALQMRAEQRVDASLKNVMNPSMEPEALFQSVESGDRKLRASEMLFVDSLGGGGRGGGSGMTPPSSSSDQHYAGSSRSDDFSTGGSSRPRRSVLSRAMKLIKDFDSRSAKQLAQQSGGGAAAARGGGKKLWEPTLPSSACVGVHLVFEVSTQMFGHGAAAPAATNSIGSGASTAHASSSSSSSPAAQAAAAVAAASVDAYSACYRLQLTPPQSPNMHWLQRVEELAEAVEEGITAVLLEDMVPLPLIVPSSWRGAHGTGGGVRVAVDESLVSAVDWHPDQALQPITLKNSSSSSSPAGGASASSGGGGSGGSKKGGKSSAGFPAAVQALLDDPVGIVNTSLDIQAKQQRSASSSSKNANLTCDVLSVTTNGLHLWAYERTCGLVRPEDALHAPIDLAVLSPPAFLPQQHIVTGLYSLTPVATPSAVHTSLSKYFGYDEAGMTSDLEILTPMDRAEAQRGAKPTPTDEDLEHRAWLEGLLETPGHVLYHLDLELTVPMALPASESSALSFAEVLKFAAVIRFLDDASVVSLHLLQSAAYDEYGVLLHAHAGNNNAAANAPSGTSSRSATAAAHHQDATAGGAAASAPLHQIASDSIVWQSPAGPGTILRAGSKLRLKAFLVLDLRCRSGAHELQSTLSTTHSHMHAAEWALLTTVISSAQLDFMLRTVDPMLCGGVQLLDSGVAGASFPTLAKTLELRASVLQSDLGSLHESLHLGSPDDVTGLLRENHSMGSPLGSSSHPALQLPPVVAATIVCSGRAETGGGYVLWNFSPANESNNSSSSATAMSATSGLR